VAGYTYKYPVYTYRYRLTVNIELDGKLRSGSSVIEIGWQEGIKLGDSGGFAPIIRGQAPIIDLGDRGIVVATLIAEDWGWHNSNAGWGALWIVPRAFGDEKGAIMRACPHCAGNANSPSITCRVSCGSQIRKSRPRLRRYSWTISLPFLVRQPVSPEPS
jgi:hypothetical protein